jgi:branched-chain amino acid transport system permease protein
MDMRAVLQSLALWGAASLVLGLWLGHGKPAPVVGMFVVSGLAVGSLYALGGIGLVVLYRATGVLNLAAGATGMIGVMLAWELVHIGLPAPLAWVAGLALSAALAFGYGRVIAPPMAWREPVVKAVASLGFALVLLGVASFLWSDDPRKFELPTDKAAVMVLGLRVTVTRLCVVAFAVLSVIGISLSLTRTRTGLQMRALADNRKLSALIGVPVVRVETMAWALSGLLFGFTGLLFGDLVRLEPAVITFMVIPCIAAAIAGRLQSLPDVLIGGLSMGVIESLLTLSEPLKSIRPFAPFAIAILVLTLMNRGRRLTFAGEE